MLNKNERLTLEDLGIDPYEFEWQDLAACNGLDVNLFFDKYEKSKSIAKQTDQICLHCPVIAECFNDGQYREETGVRAGFYLTRGQVDEAKNKHKLETPEIVQLLTTRIFGEDYV